MLRENNPASETGEFLANQFLHPNPLPNPQRNGRQKRLQLARRVGKIAMQYAVELEERFFVERDLIEVSDLIPPARRQDSTACVWKFASCFLRVKRSSCAAARSVPTALQIAAILKRRSTIITPAR